MGVNSLKAVVLTNWKRLEYKEVPLKELIKGEALVRVRYAAICGSDVHVFNGHHPTATTPIILGHEFVGTIEEICGEGKLNFKKGDRVVVEPLISCGYCEACMEGNAHVCRNLKLLGIHKDGAFSEFIKVSINKLIHVPDDLPDKIAALTEPFAVGFHVNRRGGMKNGDSVVVVGGGPIGIIIGIVSYISGASRVVFSEIKPKRINMIKDLGFEVINPAEEDIDKRVANLTDGEGFDIVFEVSGSKSGLLFSTSACRIRGNIVNVGFFSNKPDYDAMKVIFKELSIIGSRVYSFQDFKKSIRMLQSIVAAGRFNIEGIISNIYGLKDLQEAINIMESGENLGKILIEC